MAKSWAESMALLLHKPTQYKMYFGNIHLILQNVRVTGDSDSELSLIEKLVTK
jgi:hypothetical protein